MPVATWAQAGREVEEDSMIGMLVVIGTLAGLGAGIRGIALLVRGLAHADDDRASLDVIRGIRGVAVAVGTAALAAGVLLEQRWLLAFGVVFLLEELYETGVVALVLRAAQKPDGRSGPLHPEVSGSSHRATHARS